MLMRNEEFIQARVAALKKEIEELEKQTVASPATISKPRRGRPRKQPAPASVPTTQPVATDVAPTPKKKSKRRRRQRFQRRSSRVTIAPGIALTTRPGSLYATMGKVLANLGHLEKHDELFKEFLKDPTAGAAHRLFGQIAVSRKDLEHYVRADEEYQIHCKKRTSSYALKANAGSKKFKQLLKNPKIFDAGGNWIGNLDEGISILSGARNLSGVRHGKNLKILNKAGLMFDALMIGQEQFCFLYSQKWFPAFRKAKTLTKASA